MATGRFPTAASERFSIPVSLFTWEVSFASVVGAVVVGGAVVSSGAPKLPKAKRPAIAATTITPAIAEIVIILFFIKHHTWLIVLSHIGK